MQRHNFPLEERVALFRQLAGLLSEDGQVVIISACKGGTIGTNLLDIWSSGTPGFGPLPEPEGLVEQLAEAGLEPDTPRRVMPGEAYYLFVARRR